MSNIIARLSTLRYEVSKTLSQGFKDVYDQSDITKKHELFGCEEGCCAYCHASIGSGKGKKGDHFYPLVVKSRPSEYCDEFWNRVPCCAICNSSKNGKTFWNWTSGDVIARSPKSPFKAKSAEEMADLIGRFQKFDTFAKTKRQMRKINEQGYNSIDERIIEFVKNLAKDTKAMALLTEYIPECQDLKDELEDLMAKACVIK